jgi:hypothetical protein
LPSGVPDSSLGVPDSSLGVPDSSLGVPDSSRSRPLSGRRPHRRFAIIAVHRIKSPADSGDGVTVAIAARSGRFGRVDVTPTPAAAEHVRRATPPRARLGSTAMSVVPKEAVAKIQFFEDHDAPWSSNSTQVGLTTTEVAALAVKTAAARAAYDVQQAAQLAAKDATLNLRLAVTAMAAAGAELIQKIRVKAATAGDGVYALASLPAPALPSPVPPPGLPTDFTAALSQGGAVTLGWRCPNPANAKSTMYQVSRRTGATGPFVLLGATGSRKFVDDSIPAGTASVTYRIVGIRSTAQGPEAFFTVCFGVSGTGEATASVVQAPKLAA